MVAGNKTAASPLNRLLGLLRRRIANGFALIFIVIRCGTVIPSTVLAVMLRYAHAFFNQVAQSAARNQFHSIEQRCCRWLLMAHDRMPSDEFLLTQEFLAMMLGYAPGCRSPRAPCSGTG
jgi:hypothetical protein